MGCGGGRGIRGHGVRAVGNSREPRVLPAAGVGPRKGARQEDPWKETQSRVGAHRGRSEGTSRAPGSSSPELCHREQTPNFSESWCPREGLAITALPHSCLGVREASGPSKLSAGGTHSRLQVQGRTTARPHEATPSCDLRVTSDPLGPSSPSSSLPLKSHHYSFIPLDPPKQCVRLPKHP